MRKLFAGFIIIVLIGTIIRFYFIFTRDIVRDEIFYTKIAWDSSVMQIITIGHWIKDHPQLYILFLKILSSFTENIIYLRLSSVVLYIIASYVLFYFFIKWSFGSISLLPVALYSFIHYFIYIHSLISPFNLALFFFIVAFVIMSDFIYSQQSRFNPPFFIANFAFFSALIFYSDYSAIYFYLSFIPVLLMFFMKNRKKSLILFLAFFLNFIFISPGLLQVKNNFNLFRNLNIFKEYISSAPVDFFGIFSTILFRAGKTDSTAFLLLTLALLVIIALIGKDKKLKYLAFFSITFWVISLVFLYIFINSFFSIFAERSFWFFYFNLIISFTTIVFFFRKHKQVTVILLILTVTILGLRINDYRFEGPIQASIPEKNVEYRKFVEELLHNPHMKKKGKIICFNKKGACSPLVDYYLLGIGLSEGSDILNRLKKLMNEKQLIVIKSGQKLNKVEFNRNEMVVLILFTDIDRNTVLVKQLRDKYNIRVISYKLMCNQNNCRFIEI